MVFLEFFRTKRQLSHGASGFVGSSLLGLHYAMLVLESITMQRSQGSITHPDPLIVTPYTGADLSRI